MSRSLSRRGVIVGGAVLAGAAALAWPKSDKGGGHDAYFTRLSQVLSKAGIAEPVMVVDTRRLAANIRAVSDTLGGRKALRVVVKSLPCHDLIDTIATGLDTRRYMVFNEPMLAEMTARHPDGDYLMGKPLPVAAAGAYYDRLGAGAPGPQWLIDTPERLDQYQAMAKAKGVQLKVNFEIDVGLHRGGFKTPDALAATLEKLDSATKASGLMGYDPHVAKVPWPDHALAETKRIYAAMTQVLIAKTSVDLTLNTAGSPTYKLHVDDPVATEVAVGSAFIKPTDFDIDTLAHHVPAAFIATPLLKVVEPAPLPGLEPLAGIAAWHDPNRRRAFFIQGGHWLAEPASPPGLALNGLYGRSSNQERWDGSVSVPLHPDDWMFFRPTQAEAVLLQFGPLVAFDGQDAIARWPVFPMSA